MKLNKIYFSPTGGTKKVIDVISRAWDSDVTEIDLADNSCDVSKYTIEPDEICIVAVPSYGGRVPDPALERLGKLDGRNARTVLVTAYGNRAFDDTLLELKECLSKNGFVCVSAIAAVTEHSIIHQFGEGRPDAQDESELLQFGAEIKRQLESESGLPEVNVPGNYPYREYNGVPFKPNAGRKCTGCGICAMKCPVGAISTENPQRMDEGKCISCMRCTQICPQDARKINKTVLFAAAQKMKKECGGRKENKLYI